MIYATHIAKPLFNSGACTIAETNGFLKNVCQQDEHFEIIECIDSSKCYVYLPRSSATSPDVTKLCSDDPRVYQACTEEKRKWSISLSLSGNNSKYFCSRNFTKEIGVIKPNIFTLSTYYNMSMTLNMDLSTTNVTKCNGLCELHGCLDEALCNGYRYGIFCESITSNMSYVSTQKICDIRVDCESGEDEIGCNEYNHHMIDLYTGKNGLFNEKPNGQEPINYLDYKDNFSHKRLYEDVKKSKQCIQIWNPIYNPEWNQESSIPYRRLSNFTRCSALIFYKSMYIDFSSTPSALKQVDGKPYVPYCKFFMDQTNCTDPMRGVVPCMIDGYPSTVSKFATCVQKPGLCDDGFDSLCLTTTRSCNVHKHRFCNGISDCFDKSDETSKICDRMTLSTCSRRYRHDTKLPIPISWLMDGIKDCLKGEDETKIWPTCGNGRLSRYVPDSSKCEDVYICSPRSDHFVTFQDLCNGYDICDHARVCGQTRSSEHVFTNPIAIGTRKPLEFLIHCVAGVSTSLGHHISQCVKEDFLPVSIFGHNGIPKIVLPKTMIDCINVYGRVYVYLSCLKKINYDSCKIANKYEDRVFRQLGNLPMHTWGTPGAHLGHNLGHTWGTSRAQLGNLPMGHTWGTPGAQSRAHLGHISGTPRAQSTPLGHNHLGHTSGTPRAHLGHISGTTTWGTPRAHLGHKHLRHGHSGNMNYNWATIIMILLVWNTLRKLCEGRDPDVVSNPNKQYEL